MDIRTCENCVFYFPVPQPRANKVGGSCIKLGQCRKAPRTKGSDFLTTDSQDWCGEGQFLSTTINPAGSQRLYDLNGNAGGFYHNILDE